MFPVHLRKKCNLQFLDEMLYKYLKSDWSNAAFEAIISLLTFCLDDVPIEVSAW